MEESSIITDYSWLQVTWVLHVAMVLPSLVMVMVNSDAGINFSRPASPQQQSATHTDDEPKLRWWQFKKRVTQYFLFGVVFSLWFLLQVVGAYYFGREPNGSLLRLSHWINEPSRMTTDATSTLLALTLLLLHVLRRLYECMYISVFSQRQALSPLDVLQAFSVYFLAPLTLISQSPHLSEDTASKIQKECNHMLAKLRMNRAGHVVTSAYKMPEKGRFQRVSCPHFLAECVIFLSLLVMLGVAHLTAALMVLYVCLNQAFNAINVHSSYRKTFENYPKDRKAIVPYLL